MWRKSGKLPHAWIRLQIGRMNIPAASDDERGIVRIRSQYSAAVTMQRLESLLHERAIVVFARIDFSGDAARAGLTMRPEQLLVFGNPRAGTPLMVAAPTAGLDLPLKALVWEDEAGQTWIACNDPRYIVQRHGLASALSTNLAAVMPLLERAAQA
jgi:uncharacterized protein (DUF302 family)